MIIKVFYKKESNQKILVKKIFGKKFSSKKNSGKKTDFGSVPGLWFSLKVANGSIVQQMGTKRDRLQCRHSCQKIGLEGLFQNIL